MVEIEFSVMEGTPDNASYLLPLLETFQKQHHIHVNLTGITWAKGWGEVVKFGIYGHGPDVSSLGSTWIGSLASMRALRPFTAQNIHALGGPEAFFESVWQAGFLPNDANLWAVPWLGDVMMLYFWENALEKAGIHDFSTAFSTEAALVDTLEKLRKSGIAYPLAVNITGNSIILNEAAHWVWSAGGDFISADGRRVIFNEPAALEGLKKYFSLRPFISPELLGTAITGNLFHTGEAAIHLAGPWLGTSDHERPEWNGRRPGVAPMPGTTFSGGSSLVIWEYTSHPEEAFELVRFLSSQPVHEPINLYDHQVPVKRDAVHAPLMNNNVFHRVYLESMQRSRGFPTMRLWGAIEDKLMVELSRVWAELFTNPDADLDASLHSHLDPLAERLNMALEN